MFSDPASKRSSERVTQALERIVRSIRGDNLSFGCRIITENHRGALSGKELNEFVDQTPQNFVEIEGSANGSADA
jgi:hypothetical protein